MAGHLSLVDDGRLLGGARTSSIDGDGVPTSTRTLVESGRLAQVNWSVRDAAKAVADGQVEHAESTGSATRSIEGPPGTSTRDLVLTSSNRRPAPEELVAHMDDGWVVHSIMGAHTANPTSGDFSVTTSSVLRVVDGECRAPFDKPVSPGTSPKPCRARSSSAAPTDVTVEQAVIFTWRTCS